MTSANAPDPTSTPLTSAVVASLLQRMQTVEGSSDVKALLSDLAATQLTLPADELAELATVYDAYRHRITGTADLGGLPTPTFAKVQELRWQYVNRVISEAAPLQLSPGTIADCWAHSVLTAAEQKGEALSARDLERYFRRVPDVRKPAHRAFEERCAGRQRERELTSATAEILTALANDTWPDTAAAEPLRRALNAVFQHGATTKTESERAWVECNLRKNRRPRPIWERLRQQPDCTEVARQQAADVARQATRLEFEVHALQSALESQRSELSLH